MLQIVTDKKLNDWYCIWSTTNPQKQDDRSLFPNDMEMKWTPQKKAANFCYPVMNNLKLCFHIMIKKLTQNVLDLFVSFNIIFFSEKKPDTF